MMTMPVIVETPRKGDLLIGSWPIAAPGWPDGWTVLNLNMAYRRYDGIMLDHIPLVVAVRNVGKVTIDLPSVTAIEIELTA